MFGQISQYHGLVKLTCKVNHHSSHEVLTLLFSLSSWLRTLWAEEMFKYDSLSLWCFPGFLHAPPGTIDCTSHDLRCSLSLASLTRSCFYCCIYCCYNCFKCTLFFIWLSFPLQKLCRQDFKWFQCGSLSHLVIFVPTKLPLLLLTG